MNKVELVKAIANKTEITQKDVSAVLDAFQDVIKDTVTNNDKVTLTGFLTFDKKHVPAKSGTVKFGTKKGETWTTPEKDEVSVKLSKTYKTI